MPSTLTRRLTVTAAALPVTAATLLSGAVPALASGASAAPAVTAPALAPITHPDADHMGSTIRAHEQVPAQPLTAGRHMMALTAGQPMGMDVSSFQGNIDWNAAARNGAKFVYIKSTEATGYLNPYLVSQYNGAYNAGVIRGTYHFALPDRSSGGTQANYFLSNMGGWSPDGRTLPPMLDMEYNPYGATCYGMSGAQLAAWVADFSNTVNARTGRYPVIYTTTDWWSYCVGNNANLGMTNPLFIARYSSSPGTMPAGWGYQTIWQYSDHGVLPGDADVFNGSQTQLQLFATGGRGASTAPAPPPPPVVVPAITARYNQLGGARSFLGAPVGGIQNVAGGQSQAFQYGMLLSSPSTGVHEVHGSILGTYLAMGGPGGALKFPVTDETMTPDGIGRYNHFSGSGSIYWSPATGAHETLGAIRTRWSALGWERGMLGYPTTGLYNVPDGQAQDFQGGILAYSAATGVHEVHGAILSTYRAYAGPKGLLQLPITDETVTPDGIGRYNHFSGSGGSIYWSPATGAHEVQGAIRTTWASLGWERSRLGYPTSNEYGVWGGRRSNFAHGTITWTAATGAVSVSYQ